MRGIEAMVVMLAGTAVVAPGEPGPATHPARVYGVAVVGNCCTHGAGLVGLFRQDPRTRVVAAWEKRHPRAEELRAALGQPLAESPDQAISHPEVDIVAISCDPCDKAAMVEKAAAAGKAIFLNKPFADSLDSARRIAAAVERSHVWLVHDIPMVRQVPAFARLLQEVRSGRYGKVLGYHHLFGMTFDPAFDLKGVWPERLDPPSRSGGGEMTNMGCYAIDFAVTLFGRPRAVCAKQRHTWGVYREANVENFGQVVLDYGDFFALLEMGKQQMDGRHAGLMNAVDINFENHTLRIDSVAGQLAVNNVAGDFPKFVEGVRLASALDQLLLAIEQGVPPSANARSGLPATEVLMAAYQSVLNDSRPVSLPLAEGVNPLVAAMKSAAASASAPSP